jgi:hypothetical protein
MGLMLGARTRFRIGSPPEGGMKTGRMQVLGRDAGESVTACRLGLVRRWPVARSLSASDDCSGYFDGQRILETGRGMPYPNDIKIQHE